MKKIIALLLVVATMLCFAGCGGKKDDAKTDTTDLDYVKDKGTLVVGITDFKPMDYKENGEWVGFDADMAKEFGKYLGVDVEFTEIEWESKIMELDGKTIDCVWNGMTLVDEVKAAMATSKPYCNNAQIVIVNSKDADKYQTAEACKELSFAVEAGSAGEDAAKANGYKYTAVKDQATALMEVASGTSTAAIIDSLMAAAMVGEGTGYADLTYTAKLTTEEYGVGFRKESNIVDEFNKFLEESVSNGKLKEVATKYKIQASLID